MELASSTGVLGLLWELVQLSVVDQMLGFGEETVT